MSLLDMNPENIENYILRILHGKIIIEISDKIYFFRSPTIEEKNYSNYIYDCSLKKYEKYGLKSSDQLIEIARQNGFWDSSDDNYKNKFDDIILEAKNNCSNSYVAKKKLEKQIKQAEVKKQAVLMKYNDIIVNSIEQQSYEDKIKYLISRITQDENGIDLWKTYNDFKQCNDEIFLKRLIDAYISNVTLLYDIKLIRKIARSSQWRFRWIACKNNIDSLFGVSISNCNDIQSSLIYWSLVYDSVYNSLNVPSDDIINDDDRLDKWLDDRNKEDNAKRASNMLNESKKGFYDKAGKFHSHGKSMSNHQEVGEVIDGYFDKDGIFRYYTKEEREKRINDIQSRNTSTTKAILNKEYKIINEKKYIVETSLRDSMTHKILLGGSK